MPETIGHLDYGRTNPQGPYKDTSQLRRTVHHGQSAYDQVAKFEHKKPAIKEARENEESSKAE